MYMVPCIFPEIVPSVNLKTMFLQIGYHELAGDEPAVTRLRPNEVMTRNG